MYTLKYIRITAVLYKIHVFLFAYRIITFNNIEYIIQILLQLFYAVLCSVPKITHVRTRYCRQLTIKTIQHLLV